MYLGYFQAPNVEEETNQKQWIRLIDKLAAEMHSQFF